MTEVPPQRPAARSSSSATTTTEDPDGKISDGKRHNSPTGHQHQFLTEGSPGSLGYLTKKQFEVLRLRAKGYSQSETASELGLSRASVSMIEVRASRKIIRAQATITAYNQVQIRHKVTVPRGSRLQETPMLVLREADRLRIHIQPNMIDILRMVKKDRADCIAAGRITRDIIFAFNERGKLFLISPGSEDDTRRET